MRRSIARARRVNLGRSNVYPLSLARRNCRGQAHRDGAWATPAVEQAHANTQMRQDETGLSIRTTGRHVPSYLRTVAVGINLAPWLVHSARLFAPISQVDLKGWRGSLT
jgi:hypothetical protein